MENFSSFIKQMYYFLEIQKNLSKQKSKRIKINWKIFSVKYTSIFKILFKKLDNKLNQKRLLGIIVKYRFY